MGHSRLKSVWSAFPRIDRYCATAERASYRQNGHVHYTLNTVEPTFSQSPYAYLPATHVAAAAIPRHATTTMSAITPIMYMASRSDSTRFFSASARVEGGSAFARKAASLSYFISSSTIFERASVASYAMLAPPAPPACSFTCDGYWRSHHCSTYRAH
jgi:hypothetical protein